MGDYDVLPIYTRIVITALCYVLIYLFFMYLYLIYSCVSGQSTKKTYIRDKLGEGGTRTDRSQRYVQCVYRLHKTTLI